jgi:DNA-binding LytR/AlgR family response regulator
MIVDDEPLALDILENYIKRLPKLELVQRCNNALEAYDFLQGGGQVDLMFLDIHMPELTGIDFVKALSQRPQVIFTTAYDNYALEGFNLDATDYLLKPIAFDRFLKAVDKAATLHAGRNPHSAAPSAAAGSHTGTASQHAQHPGASEPATGMPASPAGGPQQDPLAKSADGDPANGFFVKTDGQMRKVLFADIRYIESMKDYVQIHTNQQRLVIHHTMKGMEKALPPKRFLRIHRSYIVARSSVVAVEGNQVQLSNTGAGSKEKGEPLWLPVGAAYRDALQAWIQRFNLPGA